MISQTVTAQMKQKECYTVYVNYPEYTLKTDVSSKNTKINVKEDRTYYWYSSNKIMETEGGYSGKILNGFYTSFFLNGNLKEKGLFKKGLKKGEWITWYDNGKIKEINTWRQGLKAGHSKNFDVNGNMTEEAEYKNGKLNGTQTNYDGGKIIRKKMFKNGIEIIRQPKIPVKESSSPKKSGNKISEKFKTAKEKTKSFFRKKDNKKIKPAEIKTKKNTPAVKPKKTFKEKIKSFFKKKDSSEKPVKIEQKGK